MTNDGFDVKSLGEKLSKLNNSQQSIESLSRWCITHRKKARQIVEAWDKMFNTSQKDQCVSFLYLANDILQNSRRKGSEFVNEFWKVLPGALKLVYDNGDESGKKAATRLVDIWEERKVFGSRVQSLKDEVVSYQGKDPAPQVVSNGKSVNPIKIVKKDAQSLRIKLAVGGYPEKILSAFHCLHDKCSDEESAVGKCNNAVVSVERIVKGVENSLSQGIQPGPGVADEMQEQESVLQHCVKQLEGVEASREALVSLLKEALQDQEAKLKDLQGQLQIARNRLSEAEILKPKVLSAAAGGALSETPNAGELAMPHVQAVSSLSFPPTQPTAPSQVPVSNILPPSNQPATSFASLAVSDEESKKAAAAAVAAKLAASTSSAQMLTSVLSSLVAQEAASFNDNSRNTGFTANLSLFSQEKRQKLENSSSVTDVGANPAEASSSPYFSSIRPPMSSMPISQSGQGQASLTPMPPPPPPPMLSNNSNNNPPSSNQFVQSAGMMLNMMMPYGFGGNGLPPPPPLPSHLPMGLARPPTPPTPQSPQSLQQPSQTQNNSAGYYRPPGIGLYGSSTQPSTPPVHRQ